MIEQAGSPVSPVIQTAELQFPLSGYPCRSFPKLAIPLLGGPSNKDYSILGLYWGPLYRETTMSGFQEV